MSLSIQPVPLTPRRRSLAGTLDRGLLLATGLAWAATMGLLVHRQLRQEPLSDDVRAAVEAAGLRKAHARARYSILMGGVEIGYLASSVTGGQQEDQLAYVVRGQINRPQSVTLRGFVVADWDQRLRRFALEAVLAGETWRLEGEREPAEAGATPLRIAWIPPGGPSAAGRQDWVLPDSPLLIPGPLPLPDLVVDASARSPAQQGQALDPVTGTPISWSFSAPIPESLQAAGQQRTALKRELRFGSFTATTWTEPSGFPLRADLPAGVTITLVEDERR